MDGSDFDSLTHTFAASISRRVTLGGLIVGLGLALEEAVVLAKNGKGNGKGKGRGNKKGRVRWGKLHVHCSPVLWRHGLLRPDWVGLVRVSSSG